MKKNFLISLTISIILSAVFVFVNAQSPISPLKSSVEKKEKYTLTAFAPSQKFKDASILDWNYINGKFNFDIGGKSYKLGEQTLDAPQKMCANSKEGQHLHIIIDNEPYLAKYTNSFDLDILDGKHYLLSFLSRSYHESIKTKKAHRLTKILVKGKNIVSQEPVKEKMIFYSRPKGTYIGDDTKKVMLDFYLANVKLGKKYKVKAEINGEVHVIDNWQPYTIEGLPMGKNLITLTLIDKDGRAVNSPMNPVTREFELKPDPLPSKN